MIRRRWHTDIGKTRTVTEGPFAESQGLISGFWLWQVRSKEEAIEWLKRAPFHGGAEFTPELRKQETRMRAKIAEKTLGTKT